MKELIRLFVPSAQADAPDRGAYAKRDPRGRQSAHFLRSARWRWAWLAGEQAGCSSTWNLATTAAEANELVANLRAELHRVLLGASLQGTEGTRQN
jgi:hypothetical protein